MDPGVGFVLWILALVLMGAAVIGIILALLLGKPIGEVPIPSSEAARPARAIVGAEPTRVDAALSATRKAAYRKGLYVFLGLVVLTVLEFLVAVATGGGAAILFVLVLAKAGLIVQYYMHVDRLWTEEGKHS